MIEPEDMKRFRRHVQVFIKAAADDPEAFAQVLGLAGELQAGMKQAASGLLDQGYSWTDIGRAAGLKRHSAHGRWRSDRS